MQDIWKELYDRFIFLRNLLFDGIFLFFYHANFEVVGKQSVLIVRLDAIGDFVLWLDSAESFRKLYPSDKFNLVLLGNALWKDLAVTVPFFDECIFVYRNRFNYNLAYRYGVWKSLRTRNWTTVIQPTFSRECLYGDAVVRVCGATERIGSQGDLSNQLVWHRWISNRWYTKLYPVSPLPIMELEKNAEFIRALGGAEFCAGLPEISLEINFPSWFDASNYVVVVPGASTILKQWPVEKFAELCERLHRMYGVMVVICGSQSETHLGKQLTERVAAAESGWIRDYTGKSSLLELVMIIKEARLLVGNDSSAVHVAAAVGTPAVCVVSGIHFGRFIPYRLEKTTLRPLPVAVFHKLECYGCNLQCVKASDSDVCGECLNLISVEDVWTNLPDLSGRC
jgi:ADP-heptose:LPS heptosyltransferase